MAKWAMVIDLDRCAGCSACLVACKFENSMPYDLAWRRVITITQQVGEGVRTHIIPRPCMMCEKAACEKVCPTGATHYAKDGTVQIDYSKCIGCKYCMIACPYGVRQYNKKKQEEKPFLNPDVPRRQSGVVEKCTFCSHRMAKGEYKTKGMHMTACSEICASGATYFGDLDDPDSEVSKAARSGRAFQLLGHLGTRPRVYYLMHDQSSGGLPAAG